MYPIDVALQRKLSRSAVATHVTFVRALSGVSPDMPLHVDFGVPLTMAQVAPVFSDCRGRLSVL